MKELEGKTVWLRPTGNNARRQAKDLKATVLNVARVNVTIQKEGYQYDEKLRYNGRLLSEGCNSGYQVYETLEDLYDWRRSALLEDKIAKFFRHTTRLTDLGLIKLERIAELLGVEVDES